MGQRVAEPRVTGEVAEEQQPRDAGRHPDHGVRHDRGRLVGGRADAEGARDDRRRERHHGHGQQQHEVPPQEAGVHGTDPRERGVMAHPEHADVGEGREIRDVAHPLVGEVAGEVAARGGDGELEHEERDGDREDTVAERLDARALAQAARPAVGHGARHLDEHLAAGVPVVDVAERLDDLAQREPPVDRRRHLAVRDQRRHGRDVLPAERLPPQHQAGLAVADQREQRPDRRSTRRSATPSRRA